MESNEGNRTGHLTIEASTIETKASISPLYRHLSHDFHILALTASSHSMHHEDNRYIFSPLFCFKLVDPV